MGTRQNRLIEAVLTSTHNLFLEQIKDNNVYPSFTIHKWGVRGYKTHGRAILM